MNLAYSSIENSQSGLSVADWAKFDGYLFDIDGTLLECRDAVHYFAFLDCLRHISGRELTLDGVSVHGSTDPNILMDALRLACIPESVWQPLIAEGLRRMGTQVGQNRAQIQAHVLPGVRQVLERAKSRGAVLGVATGNLEAIGWLKLEASGLREFFSFGGFSDHGGNRAETFRLAYKKMRELTGEAARICVIGDTPADILAAQQNGLAVVAVATGIYPFEELLALAPDVCVRSMEELLPNVSKTLGSSVALAEEEQSSTARSNSPAR